MGWLAAGSRHSNRVSPRKKRTGDAALGGGNIIGRATGHHLAATFARPRPKIDDPIGGADRFLVVFDDNHGVAFVPQRLQGVEQLDVIAGMQADGWLVEHVDHARQPRANLRGQPDALALTTGERRCLTIEREIPQAHLIEKGQSRTNLFEEFDGDHALRVVEDKRREKFCRSADR